MKQSEIPQDKCALENFTKDVYYVTDNSGKYVTDKSCGWDVKATALSTTWQDVNSRIENAKNEVIKGIKSPIFYFMEKRMMDIKIVSLYTKICKWSVKRHLKPKNFKKLSDATLKKYCSLFEINIEELKNPKFL